MPSPGGPPCYQQDLYNPADFEHDLKWKPLDGDTDVFGDGTFPSHLNSGHTPGHQSIYVEFEHRKPLPVLMGDATYSLAKMRQRRLSAVDWESGRYGCELGTIRGART